MSNLPLLVVCLAAVGLPAVETVTAAATDVALVPMSAETARPLAVGASAPLTAQVHRPDGSAVTLGAAMAGKPTVLIFYRGGWCPYCTRHLAGLATITGDLTAAGWQILAAVPDQPSVLRTAIADGDGGVPRLSDADGTLMRAFGVAFRVDDATFAKLQGYKIDLTAAAGNDHRWLPVPSVFLIAGDGTIRFVHAEPDYKVRMDPQALLTAAKQAQP